MTSWIHPLFLFAAFWTAVFLYRGERPLRFLVGLALGAALTHTGWALLHWDAVQSHPRALLDPSFGYCVLFFPLGPLLVAPDAATWRALPLALAVARVGCFAAGCDHGLAAVWGRHPTALYEAALWLALHAALRRARVDRAGPVFLAGFGAVRLAVEPWRSAPTLGEPMLAPELLAAAWLAGGFVWGGARRLQRPALAASLLLPLACSGAGAVSRPNDAEDYLRYVAFRAPGSDDMLLRWPDRKMPLRIFLPQVAHCFFDVNLFQRRLAWPRSS